MNGIKPVPLKNIVVDDPFWGRYIRLVREKVIPYQWEVLNDRVPDAARSHCIKNFEIAAGIREGEYYGMVFQDSDLYKWLESVAYSLETKPDSGLEAIADGAIELIRSAQRPDGYLNTYYTVKEPGSRWTNLAWGHELYCGGHMIEAAVAYYNATGKRSLLDIAIGFANCIDDTFGQGKKPGYPGHQEIELALFKLYEVTSERRYIELAGYFLQERGKSPNFFDWEREQPGYISINPELEYLDRSYSQSHVPPAGQRTAAGHSVRALYMYSAMADLAAECKDCSLTAACDALYKDVVNRKMYVTGAVGSTSVGESFTGAYDLPNDLIYGETCASVALMMFARRMNVLHGHGRYADVMERALYNTVLAGISLEGTEFYYVNPLESDPRKVSANPLYNHVKTVRQKWFDCSCCPTNIARTIMGLGGYLYGSSQDGLYVNLYCSSTVTHDGRRVEIKTSYPYGGEAAVIAGGGRYTLRLRNPGNAPIISLEINGRDTPIVISDGYIAIERDWQDDEVRLVFDMKPRFIYSTAEVQGNNGRAAVMRGPLVYCMEQADNGELLSTFVFPPDAGFEEYRASGGFPPETVLLKAGAYQYKTAQDNLYTDVPPQIVEAGAKFIPYFLWANRGENEMRVYVNTTPRLPER